MQREALICLAVFVTLAVVGPGHGGEPQPTIAPAQETVISTGDSLNSAKHQHIMIKSLAVADSELLHDTAPWLIQFAGTGETAIAPTTMQLDVAM